MYSTAQFKLDACTKTHIPHAHNNQEQVFIDSHGNRNHSRVIHECTVHVRASLGT